MKQTVDSPISPFSAQPHERDAVYPENDAHDDAGGVPDHQDVTVRIVGRGFPGGPIVAAGWIERIIAHSIEGRDFGGDVQVIARSYDGRLVMFQDGHGVMTESDSFELPHGLIEPEVR